MSVLREGFSYCIGDHILGGDISQFDLTFLHAFLNEVIESINVLGSQMMLRVLHKSNCFLIALVYDVSIVQSSSKFLKHPLDPNYFLNGAEGYIFCFCK
jgi:hypothetical protein